ETAVAPAGDENRQVIVVVGVAVADAAAVNEHATIEQRPLPFPGRFQFLKKISKLGRVELVDPAELFLFILAAAMVRQIVMAFRDSDEVVAAIAAIVGQHQRNDSCQIGLKSKHN